MTLSGHSVFADVIKMRSQQTRVVPKSNDWWPYKETHTQRKRAHEDGNREGSVTATSQGTPRIAGSHQKLGTMKKEFFPRTFKGSRVLPTPCFQTSGFKNCDRKMCCKQSPTCLQQRHSGLQNTLVPHPQASDDANDDNTIYRTFTIGLTLH